MTFNWFSSNLQKAIFINVGRGDVIDEASVLKALNQVFFIHNLQFIHANTVDSAYINILVKVILSGKNY